MYDEGMMITDHERMVMLLLLMMMMMMKKEEDDDHDDDVLRASGLACGRFIIHDHCHRYHGYRFSPLLGATT